MHAPGSLLFEPPDTADSLRVRAENARAGTADWKLSNYASAGEIQAYAGATSVNVGNSIDFFVSTRFNGTLYRVDVFRMGWYAGKGARLATTVTGLVGSSQGYYTSSTGLQGCAPCHYDASTGMLDANWLRSYHLLIPKTWVSGAYLARFTDAYGKQTYAPFVVREDGRASALLLQTSVNTYQAYNAWGSKSLYAYNSTGAKTIGGTPGAVKVSFNRPYDADYGSGQFLRYEYNLVRWIEKTGYDVTYATNTDVATDPSLLLNHRGFISAGHDEYWTMTQRQNVEGALAQGVNLAFLSGDAVYWHARYEPAADGAAARTLVEYRGASDPLWKTDPEDATVRWQDAPVNDPQNSLTGTIYGGQLDPFVQDWVANDTSCWLFAGTGLHPGDHVAGIVGKEYDRSVLNGASPPGLQVLSHSPVRTANYVRGDWSDSTVYTAPGGAMVFSAGSITFAWALDDNSYPIGASLHSTPVSPALQRLTANLLDAFAYGPPDPP